MFTTTIEVDTRVCDFVRVFGEDEVPDRAVISWCNRAAKLEENCSVLHWLLLVLNLAVAQSLITAIVVMVMVVDL